MINSDPVRHTCAGSRLRSCPPVGWGPSGLLRCGPGGHADHAYEEANADRLKFDEIRFSALNGVVIEEYQDDSPYTSVLVFGQTFGGDPVHSVWAYNQKKR